MARDSRGSLPESLTDPESIQHIHATASRSNVLTTFDHLTAPPPLSAPSEPKGIELVPGGLSGLYSRIKASVGGGKDPGLQTVEDGSLGTAKNKGSSKSSNIPKSPAGTAVSSPVVVSVPSSRLQSPLVSKFPDDSLPPSRDSNLSGSISTKQSLNGSKTSLATNKSRPSIAPSTDSPHPIKEENPSIKSPTATQPKSQDAPQPRELYRHPSSRDDLVRSQQGDESLRDGGSDTTEDDLVMVEGGGFANDNARFAHPLDAAHDGLTRVDSRRASDLRNLPDKVSDPTQIPHVTSSSQAPVHAPAPMRPPMVHVGPSHLPGFRASRASSSDGVSSIITSTTVRSPAIAPIDELKQQSSRIPSGNLPSTAFEQMRSKILGREFWMRDENAKDCFNCGDSFSTFRRKHHCRTCGQIFDSKCTSLVSAKMFGQSGTLRVCKPCEGIIYGNNDDSSDYSEDGDQTSISDRDDTPRGLDAEPFYPSEGDHTKIGTPTISIPMSRKAGSEKKRRSAVIEVAAPTLARPSSSRSLRSLSGRPRSSSHKRHHSRHQHMRNVRYEDRAPFHQNSSDGLHNRSNLPAFHHDNIIDPDLMPFMSDEDSTEDEQPNIFAALRADSPTHASLEAERGGFGGFLAAMKKGKPRAGNQSVVSNGHARDTDNASITSRHANRHSRRRNLSVSSIHHGRPSPRRSKSNSLLRTFGAGLAVGSGQPNSPSPQPQQTPPPAHGTKITRSSSMHGIKAPVIELNEASLEHVRLLLKQLLQDATIPHVSSWEKALMPILLQCTDDVNPDINRGDDIDIRHYIKLKKVPGGRPSDTSYVSGVVFTKNVALKSMPRNITQPRIIIVTFAIEYARHQAHFMSLEPVIAQEREYLYNLVGRIVALKPHVLLVQRHVSGLALEFLEQAGIAVAYNVKETVLNAVARCTQTPMISSVDKLAIDPSHLGRCESLDIKTYVHGKVKKTYIYLSGCQRELGCTIVLRGAETTDLMKLKGITEFMCYVVYNLKLETCLMRDEFVLIPSTSNGGTLEQQDEDCTKCTSTLILPSGNAASMNSEKNLAAPLGQNETIETHPAVEDLHIPHDAPAPSFYSELVEQHRTTILSVSPFVKFMQPYLLNQAREYERKLGHLKKLRDQYTPEEDTESMEESQQKFELVQPEMVHSMNTKASKVVRDFLHAVHAAEYDKALHNYETQKRQWETFLHGNMNLYDPFSHQKIAVLYSVVNTVTSTPCVGPEIIALNFYHEHDWEEGFTPDFTLGQYIEHLCHGAGALCEGDGCNRRMLDHHRQYAHGRGQMSVMVQKHAAKIKGLQGTILMWSCCRLCGQETQVIPMSENSWKYSFAKYLELTFWSSELHPRAGICPHDIHKDHVRYFGFHNLAVRIQYDHIPLYEIIVPRPVITWKVDADLKLKNEQFLRIEERLDRFMLSVRTRLKCIHVDSVIPEKVEICRAEVERLLRRATEEHEWLREKLQDKYMSSRYYEIIPLNRAIRAIQEKAIAWDDTFSDIEEQFFPSEKDIRRLAALQLKRIFLERDESTSSLTSVEEGAEPGTEEPAVNEKGEPLPLTPMSSNLSPEQTRDVLTSVIEEDQSKGNKEGTIQSEVSGNSSTDQPNMSAEPLTIQTPIEALERDDVRHLDLAVSSHFPETGVSREDQLMKTPAATNESAVLLDSGSPTPTALPKINPIDRSVAEAIENMPSSPPPLLPGTALESKIPRLVDTIRRDTATRPVAMTRTQSQPGGIPRILPQQATTPSPASSSGSVGHAESPKFTLSESAKALEKRMSERLGLAGFKTSKTSSMIPRSVPLRKATKVSALAKHFEQLQKEFEKERKRERLQQQKQNRRARAYPLASSKPTVEVYKDVHDAVQEHSPSDEDAQSSSAPRVSMDNSTLGDSALTETTGATTASQSPVDERHYKERESHLPEHEERPTNENHLTSDTENDASDVDVAPEDVALPDSVASSQLLSMTDSQLESSLELPKHEKTTLMKMLTSFWSERSASGWAPLEYPFAQNEHVWEDSDIIVREDEPSSIIALALSSPDYLVKLQSFRGDTGGLESSEASIEKNLLHKANTNIRYSFTNRGVRAQCKIFYAQSFDALRRKCGVADRFVESLSRCSKWDSKGGKSKSLFLKTLDERFVLKSLSPVEVQAFFRFGPNYFAFTHQNLFKGLPSVIAKMFGLFQVQIKTPNGRDFDWFMLVMENLFYDREPNRRYDLKGSMRNRKIQSTGERDEVLLDENLVDIIYSEAPIFVREHTKKLLKASVWNDTLFLSQQNVMDYSLMAGFDDQRHEIVVGIIGKIFSFPFIKLLDTNNLRLHPNIHLGQSTRVLDQRSRQEQTHHYISQGLSQSVPHRHGEIYPPSPELLASVFRTGRGYGSPQADNRFTDERGPGYGGCWWRGRKSCWEYNLGLGLVGRSDLGLRI